MNDYQLLANFTYPSDLVVVKSLLESHDIDCYVRDELTVQVHNFYSQAIGGIRLEVPKNKIELARELLINNRFQSCLISPEKEFDKSENSTNSISFQFLKLSIRLIVILSILLIVVVIGLMIFYG